ncbi:MAG: hypothetical protein HY456_00155 [Parcubacteria group bacterium]|nr:hypothetical protein [Parcubacteria group bacterium]
MQKDSKNKMIGEAENKAETALQEFHFAGGTEYRPQTVKARTYEEALEIWEKTREKVEPTQIINE